MAPGAIAGLGIGGALLGGLLLGVAFDGPDYSCGPYDDAGMAGLPDSGFLADVGYSKYVYVLCLCVYLYVQCVCICVCVRICVC